jgi:nucleoprotein TPR
LKAHLAQEREAIRHVTLQKDIELKELQTRIDKTVSALVFVLSSRINPRGLQTEDFSKTRESLIAAELSKKHLEERVEELVRQLRGHEAKLEVYERRPDHAEGTMESAGGDLNREQQLESELAELR